MDLSFFHKNPCFFEYFTYLHYEEKAVRKSITKCHKFKKEIAMRSERIMLKEGEKEIVQ